MIEVVSKKNLLEVLPLIREYQEFYKAADICDEKNLQFFSQFGESSSAGCQFIYRNSEKAIGFATVYFSFVSTVAAKIAILNDLYIEPGFRGNGVGRQLIEHCRSYAAGKGAIRLQWITALENEGAQKLYNSMNTNKSTWYLYTYSI